MRRALIVVDMQNDFITGSLPVPGALEIVGGITEEVDHFERGADFVFFTRCWHPLNHCSFERYGGKWPAHCVEGSHGAALQIALHRMYVYGIGAVVDKGNDATKEEYSAFDNPKLVRAMINVEDVFICGVAREYCVEATAESARKLGYNVTVLEDLCRSVA